MILLLMFVIGQVQTAAMQPSVDSVLRQMSSATLADRERGIASLKVLISANPSVSSDPKVQRAVASALARDNELIQQNLSAVANKQQSVISEDFAEHYSELLDVALELLDAPMTPDAKSRLIEEMVRSTYNPNSEFADRLAHQGELIVPQVVAMVRSTNGPSKWNAFSLIARLVQLSYDGALNEPLTLSSRHRLAEVARQGLRDPAADVRRYAIQAVVAARDLDAIPLLDNLAQNDPDSDVGRPPLLAERSVRRLAAEAAKTLRSMR